jgi:ABC-type lipoprotein release transport system permease subunit
MKRHLKILEHALSSLRRRTGKSLAIIVVYAFTIAVLASVLFLTHALRTEANLLLTSAPDLIVQRQIAGRHELVPQQYAEVIRRLPGVADVQPRLWGYYYDALTKANYTLMGVDPGLTANLHLLEGRMPNDIAECAVGAGVAEVRGLRLDDDLALIDSGNIGRIFTVTGIFQPESSLLANDLVVMTTDELRGFFGFAEGQATDLAVRVYNPREIDVIARKVKRELPETRPITRSEIVRTYDAVFNWRSGMLLTVFASALVAFCILAWDKATGLSAEERREIGILKAIGWDTADILLLKFWEGVAVALTAFLFGLVGALVHVFLFGAPLLSAVIKGWSVIFPDFELTPYLDLYQVCILAFLTITPYVVSTVIPSWKAAVTDPDSVMRM